MSRTPRLTGAEVIAALGRAGFSVLRIKGSHHFLRHEDGPGLLHKILSDCHLTVDQFTELL